MYDYILSQPVAWSYCLRARPAFINPPQEIQPISRTRKKHLANARCFLVKHRRLLHVEVITYKFYVDLDSYK